MSHAERYEVEHSLVLQDGSRLEDCLVLELGRKLEDLEDYLPGLMSLGKFDQLPICKLEEVLVEFASVWRRVVHCLLIRRGYVQLLDELEESLSRELARVQRA